MNGNVWQDLDTPQTSFSRESPIIFCVTCLSTSDVRKMYRVENNSFFSSITLIKVLSNSNLKVCWECNAMLDKIKKFRQRALKAHYIMNIMNKKKKLFKMPSPLTTLVHNNLHNWLSISYKNGTNPLNEKTPDTPTDISPKEEILETETLMSDTEDAYLIEEDPFSLHSEIENKIDDSSKEDERGCMDILKCECYSSSDDEPLITKARTHLEILNHQSSASSDTDSATEPIPTQTPKSTPPPCVVKTTYMVLPSMEERTATSIPNMPESLPKPPSLKVSDTSTTPVLPLAFVASSLLTSGLTKPAESTTQEKKQDKRPVEYHSGPKLFKNSPRLAIPEIFRNIEPPKQTTYEIRRMTQEQVNNYRADRMKCAKDRHWQLFCVKCVDKFTKPKDFEAHLKKHEKSAGPLMCNVCELRFPTQKELNEHKDLHYRLYVCTLCNEEYYTMSSLMRHHALVHEDVLKFCRHCDKRFTNNKDYYMHNRTHLETVKCEHCDKEMKRDKLKQHIKDYHGPMPFLKCDICHKMVEGMKKFRSHLRSTHRPIEDSGYCTECNVSFKTQALYIRHLKTTMKHKGEQDTFTCPQCDRAFPTSWYLKKHIDVQHENREVSQCDICKNVYQSKKAVRRHIIRTHLGLRPPGERRDKVCDFCGKAFTTKSCLEQHRNAHLKIRPYKCEHCTATFSYSGACYTHTRLKHGKAKAKARAKAFPPSDRSLADSDKQNKVT